MIDILIDKGQAIEADVRFFIGDWRNPAWTGTVKDLSLLSAVRQKICDTWVTNYCESYVSISLTFDELSSRIGLDNHIDEHIPKMTSDQATKLAESIAEQFAKFLKQLEPIIAPLDRE